MMDSTQGKGPVLDHHRLRSVTGTECYLLLCNGPSTLRSQQVRALNLVWALGKSTLKGKQIAVIGGGVAGLTFAAASAGCGASVHLFERTKLLHLQLGCWHRALHPEVFT